MSAQKERRRIELYGSKCRKNVEKTKAETVQICHHIQSYTDACFFFFSFYLSHFQCISSDSNANLSNKNNNFWNRSKLFCLPHQVCECCAVVIVWCLFPRAIQSPCFGGQMNDTRKGNENVLSEKLKIWEGAIEKMAGHGHTMFAWGVRTLNRLNNF